MTCEKRGTVTNRKLQREPQHLLHDASKHRELRTQFTSTTTAQRSRVPVRATPSCHAADHGPFTHPLAHPHDGCLRLLLPGAVRERADDD